MGRAARQNRGMATTDDGTLDAQAAAQIEAQLAAQAAAGVAGLTSVANDQGSAGFSPAQSREQILFHERRAARKSGRRPRFRTIDLRTA
jgi:hypothetical protein